MRFFITLAMLLFASFATSWASPSPEEFGKLPIVYDAAISPDASQIALYVNFEGQYGLRIMSLGKKDEKPRVILLGKGIKPQWVKWANNDRVLASLWKNDKYGSVPITVGFIYTLDVNSMKGKYLIRPEGIFRQYNNDVIDFLPDDPDHILMSFSNTNTFAPDIQKVNVKNGRAAKLRRGATNIQYWYTDRQGEPRVGQGRKDNNTKEKWNLSIRDANDKTWRNHEHYPGLRPDADIYGFTSDPNELIIGLTKGRDTKGLYIYDLAAKSQTRKLFHHDTYDVSGLVLSADGKSVAGATFVGDSQETELFDTYASALDKVRAKLPDFNIDYVDQSQDGKLILFNVSSAYDPGSLMMMDTNSGEVTRLARMRPGLKADDLGSVAPVRYKARDGFRIPAYMTLPPSITEMSQLKNLPFIVLPHGGPYARTSKRFDYFAQFFASRGYGVLQMNFRGSSGYGETFENAGRDNWILMQDDVEDGTRWLVEKGYADPERICIAGWSYGGYAALMGAIKNPELYACSISMAGVTDLKDMINDMKKYRFGALNARNFILKGFDDKDAIKANSPVKRAEEYQVPLFLAHGTLDQRVHYDQFKRMKSALKKSSAPVTSMTFEDEDHFLSHQENRVQFFIGLDAFLRQHMGSSEFEK